MNANFSFFVPPADTAKRLDVFLAERREDLSRSQVKKMIASGHIQVGGKKSKPGLRLQEGDYVQGTLPEPQKLETQPEAIPLVVLYEDPHLIVVDKPAGMVVHPAAGNYSGTLVHALLYHCTDLSGIGGALRPGIVHRLDKDTSGVLVSAKDDRSHRGLAEQFKNHTPLRRYIGIVFGQLPDVGEIEASIGRDPVHRQKMSTRPRRGREAKTHWRVTQRFRRFNVAEFRLETGRTHQIRVHLSSLSHPLLGDPLYGGRKRLASVEPPALRQGLLNLRRQALHAASLGFVHPITGDYLQFSTPLPPDIQEVIALLEKLDKD